MNDTTKLASLVAALAVAAAGGVLVFGGATDDATIDAGVRSAAAAVYDGAPYHTELGGELVQPGAEDITGVTLPLGATALGVVLTGSAGGQFDVESLTTTPDNDPVTPGTWCELHVHSRASAPLRFTAELGYAPGSGGP